jgi:putative solute:sodium symporter small subunit
VPVAAGVLMAEEPAPTVLTPERRRAYWRRNLAYVAVLLAIWAAVSYGCGILFAEELNAYRFPGSGFKLGFWFAQQGSIYTFVVLIFVYVRLMNRLDADFGVTED